MLNTCSDAHVTFYDLNSFIGLMPMEHSSGEREMKGRITVH